ncbi:MAG: alpha/beta hydrolase [Anaerolineales bacterium]|nr:alpha/beta hydrolase [Anaerolineales bacterium]
MEPEIERQQINTHILELETEVEPIKNIRNIHVPFHDRSIPVRIYTPPMEGPFPLLVYIHGAGWVAGNLDTHDNICRRLAARGGCVVLSIGYSLAPEAKFPVPVEESHHVLVWAVENAASIDIDSRRVVLAGDSAGGNLAAAVCLMARDRGGPKIIFQLLVNPALDQSAYDGPDFEQMKWFREQYLRDKDDISNPYASPLLAGSLAGLPPAFIITGEHDELCAEGEAYGRRLREAGVHANVYRQAGMGHLAGDFARATAAAEEAVDLSIAVLKAALKR